MVLAQHSRMNDQRPSSRLSSGIGCFFWVVFLRIIFFNLLLPSSSDIHHLQSHARGRSKEWTGGNQWMIGVKAYFLNLKRNLGMTHKEWKKKWGWKSGRRGRLWWNYIEKKRERIRRGRKRMIKSSRLGRVVNRE